MEGRNFHSIGMLDSYRGPVDKAWYRVYVVYLVNGERRWTVTEVCHHSAWLAWLECLTILEEGIVDDGDGSNLEICKLSIRRFDNVEEV